MCNYFCRFFKVHESVEKNVDNMFENCSGSCVTATRDAKKKFNCSEENLANSIQHIIAAYKWALKNKFKFIEKPAVINK